MKILLIHPFIQIGGGELVIVKLANYFAKKGLNVGILCCFVDKKFEEKIDKRVRLHTPLPIISHLCKRHRFFLLFIGFPYLFIQTILLSFSYSILFPHNFPGIFFAAVAKSFTRRKIVWEYNEGAPMSKKLYFLEDMVGKHADAIIVLDNKNKERVKNRFSHTAFVLRPGVDVAYWSQKISSDKQYVNKIVLLSVGKLHPQKNQILLVDVVASLLPKIPSIHLILVGKGPDEERIKKRIRQIHLEKYITLAGSVDNATLRKLYHTAFIVCFPALDQTWGLTPFEALCQKTVSIVSSEAGSAEVLKPHHLSLIANPSLHDFAQTILDAYKNKSKVEIIGQRGYAYVKENLQWDNFCKDAEMILNKTYNKI